MIWEHRTTKQHACLFQLANRSRAADTAYIVHKLTSYRAAEFPVLGVLAATVALPLLAGEMVIKRHATELAAICQRIPTLWRQAFDNESQTCLPRAIQNS